MKRPSARCSYLALIAPWLSGCLLPAIDDTGTARSLEDDERDAAQVVERTPDAATGDGAVPENLRDETRPTSSAGRDAASVTAVSVAPDHDAAGVMTTWPRSDMASAGGDGTSLTDTSVATDAGACGAWGQACCGNAPSCGDGLLCQSGSCLPPAKELLRVAYSHVPSGSQVAGLEYLEFSQAAGKLPERRLFTRPSIGGMVGSSDGERLAFLANDTSDVNSPEVVWLIDGVGSAAAPFKVASSNPALPRVGLFGDGSLDNVISCSGFEPCDQLELYRTARGTFTSIATDVWSPLVGDSNGLLLYNDGLNTFWVDLTEADLEPRLVMSHQDPESVLWIQPGQLAMNGRTACIMDVIRGPAPNGSKHQWTAYAVQLGLTDLVPLASGVGLFACYVQDDGSSVVLATTDGQTQSSTLVRYAATATGFEPGQELFEQGINLGEGAPGNPGLFTTPILDGYHSYFPFFGTPAAASGGTVYLTPYAIDVGSAAAVAVGEEWCEVIASGHDMVSPQTALSKSLAAAGSAKAWMHCNRKLGYVDMSVAESFTVVDDSCTDCSPATFAAVGDGLVYSQFTSSSLLTPHVYVTGSGTPLEVIAGGEQIGQMRDIFVAQASERSPSLIAAWTVEGNLRVDLPRTWLKRSRVEDAAVVLDASPELDIEADPLAGRGFSVLVTPDVLIAPEQVLANAPVRAQCALQVSSDSGSLTVADGTAYAFSAERRSECGEGRPGTRWLIALQAADHTVQLVYQDPDGSAEQAFYALVDSLHVEPTRLPGAEPSAPEFDAGATEMP